MPRQRVFRHSLNIRLDDDLAEQLRRFAEDHNTSESEAARELMRSAVELHTTAVDRFAESRGITADDVEQAESS